MKGILKGRYSTVSDQQTAATRRVSVSADAGICKFTVTMKVLLPYLTYGSDEHAQKYSLSNDYETPKSAECLQVFGKNSVFQMKRLDEASAPELPYPYQFVGHLNADRYNKSKKH